MKFELDGTTILTAKQMIKKPAITYPKLNERTPTTNSIIPNSNRPDPLGKKRTLLVQRLFLNQLYVHLQAKTPKPADFDGSAPNSGLAGGQLGLAGGDNIKEDLRAALKAHRCGFIINDIF